MSRPLRDDIRVKHGLAGVALCPAVRLVFAAPAGSVESPVSLEVSGGSLQGSC
jgi:hypothetical protein